MKYDDICIPTYVINLLEHIDRRKSIEVTFKDKKEFEVHLVKAIKHPIGAVGLWKSITGIIKEVVQKDEDDVIIICEDDHVFTENYQRNKFLGQVMRNAQLGTQILFGGIGGFGEAVPIEEGLFWINWNWSTQFMVIYRSAFNKILNARFSKKDVADEFLSKIIPNKVVIHPFISIQREFGYSDITKGNEREGQVGKYFDEADLRLKGYKRIVEKYNIKF
ncbi:glycosyltransferase [Prevotella melaninogenica]|uniref:glycosyltransferase n=1 Tax=Prevotella melaninogenica TaxID=28132 RepID=UPI001C5DE8F7|nr:glycosyltransferase [Prevotella melaninogenica]MBW4763336.1 glycosyltransferase [Prevotella melaninogenica]